MIERPDWNVPSTEVANVSNLPAPAGDAFAAPTVTLDDEWSKNGGKNLNAFNAQLGVEMVLGELHPDDRQTFAASFDALPESVQGVVFSEIALDADSFVRSVSASDLAAFRASDVGELAQEWRGKAGRNLGVVRQRIDRILDRLPESDAGAAINWFDGLAPDAARAVLRMLVT